MFQIARAPRINVAPKKVLKKAIPKISRATRLFLNAFDWPNLLIKAIFFLNVKEKIYNFSNSKTRDQYKTPKNAFRSQILNTKLSIFCGNLNNEIRVRPCADNDGILLLDIKLQRL